MIFFALLFLVIHVQGMDVKPNWYCDDSTPLHYYAQLPKQLLPKCPNTISILLLKSGSLDMLEYDRENAKWSAFFLIASADIYKKNDNGKTALDYIEQNKEQLPETYKVMMAGKVIADIEKQFPKKAAACRSKEDWLSVFKIIGKRENFKKWCEASLLLYDK